MPFNSYAFILGFLPITVLVFWVLVRFAGRDLAVSGLLAASIIFYSFSGLPGLAIVASTLIFDYAIALWMLRLSDRVQRKFALIVGIVANILLLGYFKYKNFFVDAANTLFGMHAELTQIIFPLGISFMTFQKIGFLADVYSGQVKTVRLLDFSFFILFFPRVVSGPIVHYQELTPQLDEIRCRGALTNIAVGLCLFSIGLFKKTFIADRVAPFVTPVFAASPEESLTLLTAWVGVLAYTFQLYFDFSGYSDMALGVARMTGIRLPINFNSPLKATSILDFWSRWHITLTRFLTAYIYTPMVLHLTRARMAANKPVLRKANSSFSAIVLLLALPMLTTMVVSGLWHGAGWQFVIWGALHGVYLTINHVWRRLRPRFWQSQKSYDRVMKPLGLILTFSSVVIAMVFFRATSVSSAFSIFQAMFGANGILPADIQILHSLGMSPPWALVTKQQPVEPFIWLTVLLVNVLCLPNSLELLRRFSPALDFQDDQPGAASIPDGRIRYELSMDRTSAVVVALIFVLGLISVQRASVFLYANF